LTGGLGGGNNFCRIFLLFLFKGNVKGKLLSVSLESFCFMKKASTLGIQKCNIITSLEIPVTGVVKPQKRGVERGTIEPL
jgi:hypothetical protein